MGNSVVASVESPRAPKKGVDPPAPRGPALTLRLLGRFAVHRDGLPVPLPTSRKVRALIAYLALTPRPVLRSHLCELLWDVPHDPRGELRWCLSKARGVLDAPGRQRIESVDQGVRLDRGAGFACDVLSIDEAFAPGIARLDFATLHALSASFTGEFLEGLEIERSPRFSAWLLAQRRRLRACHVAVMEHLVRDRVQRDPEQALPHLEKWLELAPFDRHAHQTLLAELARSGRLSEGEEHLARTIHLFEAEGLDWRPLGAFWRAARPQRAIDGLPEATSLDEQAQALPADPRRATIAVMPFGELIAPAPPGKHHALAGGFAHDLIMRLSRLRSLFVIAPGTMFELHARSIGSQDAARTLDADYAVGGSIRLQGPRVAVEVELIETRSARVLWADTFEGPSDQALRVLDEIGDGIIASVDREIEAAECDRAMQVQGPDSLDAWEAHHRGLWHMYRFNQADNARARHWFEIAVRLDPRFSRAFAGLSFTYWQDAFQRWTERQCAVERAFRTANQSLRADERDPAAHLALGRALWLRDRQDEAVAEMKTAVEASPSFALGHYTLAFVHSQSGDPAAAIAYADQARRLSPFDPLLFGMLGARALALVRQGDFPAAAQWAVRAASRPNAHVHIQAIAAFALALAERRDEAAQCVAAIRRVTPVYRLNDFLAAFHFCAEDARLFESAAERCAIE